MEQGKHLILVVVVQFALRRIERNLHVPHNRHEFAALRKLLPVLRERFLLTRGQFKCMLKNAFDVAVFLQERAGGFGANAAHAGHVIGGVAHKSLIVDDLRGGESLKACRHFLGANFSQFAGARPGHEQMYHVVDELVGIGVAGHDKGRNLPLRRLARKGAKHVVGLVARNRKDRDAEGLHHLPHPVHLLIEQRIAFRTRCFVLGVLLVAEGGAGEIEGYHDILGLDHVDHMEQRVREAKDRVGQFAGSARKIFRHREKRPMDNGVSIYENKRIGGGLGVGGTHLGDFLSLVSLTGVPISHFLAYAATMPWARWVLWNASATEPEEKAGKGVLVRFQVYTFSKR